MRDLRSIIERRLAELVELRHELHAHPELGYQEQETARRILSRLEGIPGLEIRRGVAETGVVATLGREKPGLCVALRADMDALPIQEQTGKPYASRTPGRMHACGHDGHVTCLVGAVWALAEIGDELDGPIKFVFQPAEEGGAGGQRMVAEGVLENPTVHAIFALHGWPTLDVGAVGARAGAALASTNPFAIEIRGEGSHAAYPHLSVDPVVIAAHVIVALQTVVSRNTNPLDSVVVTVGAIEGGTAENIIPPTVRLRGTIRTLSPAVRQRTLERVTQVAQRTAEALGGRADVAIRDGYPALINDARATAYFVQTARDVLGMQSVADDLLPSMGGEDFAYYAQKVPAAFWRLGVRPVGRSDYPGLHQPTYDFTDEAIAVGVRLHCELARRFAREWKP